MAYFLRVSSKENDSVHMEPGNFCLETDVNEKPMNPCILMTYALGAQTFLQRSAGVKTAHVDTAPHMQGRQTMPAVDCLLWPPYGQ